MHGMAIPVTKSLHSVRDVPAEMKERLIVALDVKSPKIAQDMVAKLDGTVSFFKIGFWLLFADGTDALVKDLIDAKKKVFLDYKMFDIPETVKEGVSRAKDRGVKFVTVHGTKKIMSAAVEGKGDSDFLKVFAITVLTSLNQGDVEEEMGITIDIPNLIKLRVNNALSCGCDGIIASAKDDPDHIRSLFGPESARLLIATPGIRRAGESHDDHKRSATPEQAIRAGADYLVVGRPILDAPNALTAAKEIIADMEIGAAR